MATERRKTFEGFHVVGRKIEQRSYYDDVQPVPDHVGIGEPGNELDFEEPAEQPTNCPKCKRFFGPFDMEDHLAECIGENHKPKKMKKDK